MTPPPAPFPLSKICDLVADAEPLASSLAQIQAVPGVLGGQHPVRGWEYAMTLRAIAEWSHQRDARAAAAGRTPTPRSIADVGGAGSEFWRLLVHLTDQPVAIIDPRTPHDPRTVEQVAATEPHDQFDVLTCISVIEHVEFLRPFFRACRMLLAPGGLLVLTTDCWDSDGPDLCHYHWMRKRIYNVESLRQLQKTLRLLGFARMGSADWTYHGPQIYDYSVASLVVTK